MAAAEVNLVLGNMCDSGESSRHNLLYLLQNFALHSTTTCPDLYFFRLRNLVTTFQDQLQVRCSPPSFMVVDVEAVPIPRGCSVPMPYSNLPMCKPISNQVEPEITLPWTIKQETQSHNEVTSNDTNKNMSFSNYIDSRRKVSIKRDHKCWWCKAVFRYYQNLRNHEQVCPTKPVKENTTLSCSHCSKIFHSGADLKSHYKQNTDVCKRYLQMNSKSRNTIKQMKNIDFYPSRCVRSRKRQCKINK